MGPWLGLSPQLTALLLSPIATGLTGITTAVTWVRQGKERLFTGLLSVFTGFLWWSTHKLWRGTRAAGAIARQAADAAARSALAAQLSAEASVAAEQPRWIALVVWTKLNVIDLMVGFAIGSYVLKEAIQVFRDANEVPDVQQ